MSRAIDRMPEPLEYREKKVIIIARSRLVDDLYALYLLFISYFP